MSSKQIAIVGGGAAGFFAAMTAAEFAPDSTITIYEKGQKCLTKVKISGGGRCNVTHSCFTPKDLITRYPRGSRELRGAFHRWQPQDTIQWFADRDVQLKTEDDGRMFPLTDDSQTIIDCFLREIRQKQITVEKGVGLESLNPQSDGKFAIERSDGRTDTVDKVCVAAGSLKASPLVRGLEKIGHHIEPLAPSLFAFNIADKRTHGLAGISVSHAQAQCVHGGEAQSGPLLITHRGLSGPVILRLSAWEARSLQSSNYHFGLRINWLGNLRAQQVQERFQKLRKSSGSTKVDSRVFDELPRRLWERLVAAAGIDQSVQWSQLSKDKEIALLRELTAGEFNVIGKTTNKEEFVTCGGVRLSEVDFRTMESKLVPGLHFAGESLDIDGITGGFNFQAAWTTGRIAGMAMVAED